jgi:hypothetical protein
MKYFILLNSSDPKVLGLKSEDFDQVIITEESFKNKEAGQIFMKKLDTNFYFDKSISIDQIEPGEITVKLRGNLTDFLSFSPAFLNCPFLISERYYNMFIKFRGYKTTYWPVFVQHSKKKSLYYLIHLEMVPIELLDLYKSIFYTGSPIIRNQKYIIFDNNNQPSIDKIKNLHWDTACLSSSFEYDFFSMKSLPFVFNNIFLDALQKLGNPTGVNIRNAFGDVIWTKVKN